MPPNAFADVEQFAKRQKLSEDGKRAISRARSKLVLGKEAKHAFFATLALKLKLREDWTIDTANVDGKTMCYNPEFFATLSVPEAIGVVAHEVMHCVCDHMVRRQGRDPLRWNIACDLAINVIIRQANLELPKGCLMPGEGMFAKLPSGLSAEEYYSMLPDCKTGSGGDSEGPGWGAGADPGGCGGVLDAGDAAAKVQASSDWKTATAQAANIAKQRGTMPAGLDRLVHEVLNPKVDWRDVLRRFVSATAKNDYSWSPPNRRYVHQGLYLPSNRSEELGRAIVAIDTSGSINQEMLDLFAAEVQAVLEAYSCDLEIIYCDAAIGRIDHWSSTDGPLVLTPCGGGGTDHVPVFNYIEASGEVPTCLICLTDGYTNFPDEAPDYPVLWALTTDQNVPFGERLQIED